MEPRVCKNFIVSEKPGESIETLHFVASFDAKKRIYTVVCSTQPLTTIWTTNDKPLARCPACGAKNPLRGEADGIQPE